MVILRAGGACNLVPLNSFTIPRHFRFVHPSIRSSVEGEKNGDGKTKQQNGAKIRTRKTVTEKEVRLLRCSLLARHSAAAVTAACKCEFNRRFPLLRYFPVYAPPTSPRDSNFSSHSLSLYLLALFPFSPVLPENFLKTSNYQG